MEQNLTTKSFWEICIPFSLYAIVLDYKTIFLSSYIKVEADYNP